MLRSIGKVRAVVAVLLLFVLVLAGCGGGKAEKKPATTATESTQAASASPAVSATVPETAASETARGGAPLHMAIASTDRISLKHVPLEVPDFYQEDNITIEIQEYQGGSDVIKALLQGETNMAAAVAQHVLRDPSGELRILAVLTTSPGHALIVAKEAAGEIKSVADLKGKQVGVSNLGAATHQTLVRLLKQSGVDETDVIVLPVGLNAKEVFAEGRVQATVTLEPFISEAVAAGMASVLVDSRTPQGTTEIFGTAELPWVALVSTADYIQREPETVQRVVTALVRTLQYMNTASPAEVVAALPADFRQDEALWIQMLSDNRFQFSADGRISRQGLNQVWENLQETGSVSKDQPLPWDNSVESRFVDQAQAR